MDDLIQILGDKFNSLVFAGIGYVIIPSDVNREEYINYCFVNESVSIYPEVGGISYNNIKVSSNCLNSLEFPEGGENFGSCVIYLLFSTQKTPIIIGVLSKKDENLALNYKLFKLVKSLGNNSVSITGDGKEGNLFVNVQSDTNSGGQIIIDVNNLSKNGVFKLSVKGNIFLLSNNIEFSIKENFRVKSKSVNFECSELLEINSKQITLKGDKIQFLNKSIEIGEKNLQYVVLGETLKNDVITPLLSLLQSFSVIVTSFGPTTVVSPETITKIKLIEQKMNGLLSEKVKVE